MVILVPLYSSNNNQSISQSINQSGLQSDDSDLMHRFRNLSRYSVHRSKLNLSINQSIACTRYRSTVNLSIPNDEQILTLINQSVHQTANQSVNQSIDQSVNRLKSPLLTVFNPSIFQSIDRSFGPIIDQSIDQPINKLPNQLTDQSVNQPFVHSIIQSVNRSISQPSEKSVNQSSEKLIDKSDNQTIAESAEDNQSVNINQSASLSQSINISQSVTDSQSINLTEPLPSIQETSLSGLTDQLIDQPINQSINHLVDQSITHPINQPVSQPVDQPIKKMSTRPKRTRTAVKYEDDASDDQSMESQTISQSEDQSVSPVKRGRKRKTIKKESDDESIDQSINEVISTEIKDELKISTADQSVKGKVKKPVKRAKASAKAEDDSESVKPVKASKSKIKQPPTLPGIAPLSSTYQLTTKPVKQSINMSSKKLIGGHVSAAGGVHFAVYSAAKTGARAFAFDLKSKRRWVSPPMDPLVVQSFHQLIKQYDYSYDAIVPHGSYLINLGSLDDELYEKSKAAIKDELERCQLLGINRYVFHPGSSCLPKKKADASDGKKKGKSTKKDEDEEQDEEEEEEEEDDTNDQSINQSLRSEESTSQLGKDWVPPSGSALERSLHRLIDALDWVSAFESCKDVRILIETMAGQGSCLASKLEEIAYVIQRVKQPQRIGVCIDTCHMFAAGYDLRSHADYEAAMKQLDDVIGFEYVKAAHINDSMCGLSSRRDRHQNIGDGLIGSRVFHSMINDPRWDGIPLILETPCMPFDDEGKIDKTMKVAESKKDWVRSYGQEISILYSYENEEFIEQPPRQPVVELVSKTKAAKQAKEAAKNTKSINSFFQATKPDEDADADVDDDASDDEKPKKKRTVKPKVIKAKVTKAKAPAKKKT